MFWKKAKKTYGNIKENDPDIIKYNQIVENLQKTGYKGILAYIQDMGHKFVSSKTSKGKILEIGFGRGRQAKFFKGNKDNYFPTEINNNYENSIWRIFKNFKICDAKNLPFKEEYFDKVVSIYNLEHIDDVDKVLKEVNRVLKKNGKFIVILPCEDGFFWNIGRELTTRRIYSKKYNLNYDKVIAYEHKYNLKLLLKKLQNNFKLVKKKYYPFFIPLKDFNLVYCGVYKKNKKKYK